MPVSTIVIQPSATRAAHRALTAIILAGAVAVAAACGTTDPVLAHDPLAGLTEASATDSAGNPAPTTTDAGPGSFHGTVLGPSEPGAGNDSLLTAPRIAGVRVTVYRVDGEGRVGEVTADLGIPLDHVFTDAQGRFQLPVLPGGRYAVGFVPPAGSPYSGVFAIADAHPTSNTHPWWVVLPRRTTP